MDGKRTSQRSMGGTTFTTGRAVPRSGSCRAPPAESMLAGSCLSSLLRSSPPPSISASRTSRRCARYDVTTPRPGGRSAQQPRRVPLLTHAPSHALAFLVPHRSVPTPVALASAALPRDAQAHARTQGTRRQPHLGLRQVQGLQAEGQDVAGRQGRALGKQLRATASCRALIRTLIPFTHTQALASASHAHARARLRALPSVRQKSPRWLIFIMIKRALPPYRVGGGVGWGLELELVIPVVAFPLARAVGLGTTGRFLAPEFAQQRSLLLSSGLLYEEL